MTTTSSPNTMAAATIMTTTAATTAAEALEVAADEGMLNKKMTPDVELVRLDLENITYAPITKQSSASTGSGKAQATRTTVLSNVTTSISPYELTAWMGPSGSGKTSLISVAANLIASRDDIVGGEIRTNGDPGILPKRLVGVVWQDDLLLSNLTVEETIFFSARLKTPSDIADEKVQTLVENIMEELGLLHVRHSLIGSSTGASQQKRGISGGERKRVSVASELVVRPSLLLLDEPTSGLDATTAWSLISTLQQLAHKGGHAIAVVIHQPRTEIFNMFDHLLLLNHGETVYNGPPKQARTYLESVPSVTPLPPETGIADWIMDIIKADDDNSENNLGEGGERISLLASHWANMQQQQQIQELVEQPTTAITSAEATSTTITTDPSPPNVEMTAMESSSSLGDDNNHKAHKIIVPQQQQQQDRVLRRRMSSLKELQKSPNYVTPFRMQLKLLTQRTLKQMRGEKLTKTSILLTFAYTFFSCLFWWQLPDNTGRIYERNSLLFFMLIAQSNGIVVTSVSVFQQERALLQRERAKKLYGVLPFFIAKTLSDMTNNVLLPCVYGAITYWGAGFRPDAEHFFKFLLIFYLTMAAAQSMGLFLSVVIPSMAIALILAPPITLFFMIMGGFYIPFDSMPAAVRWLSWLSFARYGYSSMLVNEFAGRDVPCASDTGHDAAISIGAESGYCPLPGEDVVASMGIDGVNTNFWFGVLIITMLQVAFRVASYVVLRRTK